MPDLWWTRLTTRLLWQPNGCWTWTGALDPAGYGRARTPCGGTGFVHRLVYQRLIGPIPDGLVLDHLCRVPRCANPLHLEAVTQQTNFLRSQQHRSLTPSRTGMCATGLHPFDAVNAVTRKDGRRYCRECNQAGQRRRRSLKRERALAWQN